MVSSIKSFVRYTPAVEQPEFNKAESARGLIETPRSISDQTLADSGHAMRNVHAKAHGILHAELEVAASLLEYFKVYFRTTRPVSRRDAVSVRFPATSSTTTCPRPAAWR